MHERAFFCVTRGNLASGGKISGHHGSGAPFLDNVKAASGRASFEDFFHKAEDSPNFHVEN